MFEFMPFLLGAAFGTLVSRSTMRMRPLLSGAAALFFGVFATMLSGESFADRTFLPNDVAEAAVGLAFGTIAARAIRRAHYSRL